MSVQAPELRALLAKAEVCSRLAISLRCLENLVRAGSFPPGVRIGKQVYWSEKALNAWQQRLFGAQENWRP